MYRQVVIISNFDVAGLRSILREALSETQFCRENAQNLTEVQEIQRMHDPNAVFLLDFSSYHLCDGVNVSDCGKNFAEINWDRIILYSNCACDCKVAGVPDEVSSHVVRLGDCGKQMVADFVATINAKFESLESNPIPA